MKWGRACRRLVARAHLFRLAAVAAAFLLIIPAVSSSQNKSGGAKPGASKSAKSGSSGKSSSGSKSSGASKSSKSSGKSGTAKSSKSSKSSGKSGTSKGTKSSGASNKAASCGKATWHKVVTGDTLWELAGRYRTTVAALERMNGKKAKNLKPGVRLMVKPAKPCPKPKQVPKPKELAKPPEPDAVTDAEPDAGTDASTAPAAKIPPDAEAEAGTAPAAKTQPDVEAVSGAPVEVPGADDAPVALNNVVEIVDEFDSGGAPAVNLPTLVAGTPIDGLHPDEELSLYNEAAEMGGDDLPVVVNSPGQYGQMPGSAEADGDLYPSDDEGEIVADEIESGEKDPYSGDGVPEDLVELPEFPEFGFRDDGAECAYYLDAMSPMPKNPKGTVNIYHKVRKGDNLSKIAKKYKTTVRNLENLNRIRGNKKKAQRLMHPGKMVMVRLGDPKDLLAARPFLGDWVQLKTQKGYNIKRPAASYGRPWAMNLMLRAMCEFRRRNPDAGNIVVGDWSGKVGGQLGRHLSHRTGRDVDLSYFITGKPGLKGFVRATPSTMDVELSWELVRALLDTRQIEFIFMDWSLQKAMYEHARSKGFPEAELNQIFQYPEGRRVRSGIIRWARGHDNHIHVRFRCPKDDKLCR